MLKKLLAATVVALAATSANAIPINGAFSVSGNVTPLGNAAINLATGLDFATPSGSGNCAGDLIAIVGGGAATCNGATSNVVDLAAGTLNVGALAVNDWITLSLGGVRFDLTSITAITRTAGGGFIPASIEIVGTGVMQATGWTDTTGGFRLTAQGGAGSFSFSGTQISAAPEPGSLALIGIVLAGLGFARRKA